MNYLGKTMTLRSYLGWSLLGGLALAMSGCATPPAPAPLPPIIQAPPPPPPTMPAGGYIGMKSATKRADGKYVTPNLDNTDQAAVWHLRNALNVAALGCDQAGGGVLDAYNAWLRTRAAVIDRYYQAYIREWQAPGWWDWQRVYDDNQTRIYNFYAQPAMRSAFCAVAREEVAQVGQVADDDLPAFARAALQRLDRPFVEFYAAYDAWRDYYEPAPPLVVPPPVAPASEIPVVVPPPPMPTSEIPVAAPPSPVPASELPIAAPPPPVPASEMPVAAPPSPMPTSDIPVAAPPPPVPASEMPDAVTAPPAPEPVSGNAPVAPVTETLPAPAPRTPPIPAPPSPL